MKSSYLNSIFILLVFSSFLGTSQGGFKFFNNYSKYDELRFELINNLIVIPLEINGNQLNFIFDTGVNKTIVFNANKTDTVFFRSKKLYRLRGLGSGQSVNAIISNNNRFRINNLIAHNQSVYIMMDDKFDLSAKMGKTIHGVIGYDILKNLIVEIDYRKKKIRFHDSNQYNWKKCKKCEEFPLTIYRNKPYIDASVIVNENEPVIPVKMLIDSGGSDALWIFEYSKEYLVTPEKYFEDFLGVGLSGTIYGNRSRISELQIGSYRFEGPTVSFLDSVSTEHARTYKARNGSIGSNILKRFKVWFDYSNQRVMLKKSASFKDGFQYNMSGLEVVYDGKSLVEVKNTKFGESYGRDMSSDNNATNSVSLITSYSYKFKPRYRINNVVKGSPADLAGLMKDDILFKINGNFAHNLKLSELMAKFHKKPNRKMKLVVLRGQATLVFEFRLKKVI